MTPTYQPRPLDTANTPLPDALDDLLEQLAANTHEVWAELRIRQGWRFGPTRDDHAKEHPCLVPYDQLPEQEKEFDRATVRETLKAIVCLGYRVTR